MSLDHFMNYKSNEEILSEQMQDWTIVRENNADFFSKENQEYFISVMKEFNFKTEKIIVFVPCASKKPISKSRTHCYLSPITRNQKFEIIIISEPQSIIPYSLEYKAPNYDFPPEKLNKFNMLTMVQRICVFLSELKEQKSDRTRIYYIGANHHYKLLKRANKYFDLYSMIPRLGIRSYNSAALQFKEFILRMEGLI